VECISRAKTKTMIFPILTTAFIVTIVLCILTQTGALKTLYVDEKGNFYTE